MSEAVIVSLAVFALSSVDMNVRDVDVSTGAVRNQYVYGNCWCRTQEEVADTPCSNRSSKIRRVSEDLDGIQDQVDVCWLPGGPAGPRVMPGVPRYWLKPLLTALAGIWAKATRVHQLGIRGRPCRDVEIKDVAADGPPGDGCHIVAGAVGKAPMPLPVSGEPPQGIVFHCPRTPGQWPFPSVTSLTGRPMCWTVAVEAVRTEDHMLDRHRPG